MEPLDLKAGEQSSWVQCSALGTCWGGLVGIMPPGLCWAGVKPTKLQAAQPPQLQGGCLLTCWNCGDVSTLRNPGEILFLERNQDGGVEGCALTPSCENTRITTSCWTIIDRKTLELTKKDTPHRKTKEKPQWDGRRGTIRVKSNPITGGWVTHRLVNTYTTEVCPLEWRFWAPRQASQPGGPATGGGIHRESDFEA